MPAEMHPLVRRAEAYRKHRRGGVPPTGNQRCDEQLATTFSCRDQHLKLIGGERVRQRQAVMVHAHPAWPVRSRVARRVSEMVDPFTRALPQFADGLVITLKLISQEK